MNSSNAIWLLGIILTLGACKPRSFYPISGFGKLTLLDDQHYYFHNYENGNDTGFYSKIGDTLFLTSSKKPISFIPLENVNQQEIESKGFLEVSVRIIEPTTFIFHNGNYLLDYCKSIIDTTLIFDFSDRVYVDNLIFRKGTILIFSFLEESRFLVEKDMEFRGYFQLPSAFAGKFSYFNQFPLIQMGRFLLPFDRVKNEEFRMLNGGELAPMRRGRNHKYYSTYKTGFGEIN